MRALLLTVLALLLVEAKDEEEADAEAEVELARTFSVEEDFRRKFSAFSGEYNPPPCCGCIRSKATSTGLWGCNLPSPGILGKASAISGAQLAT